MEAPIKRDPKLIKNMSPGSGRECSVKFREPCPSETCPTSEERPSGRPVDGGKRVIELLEAIVEKLDVSRQGSPYQTHYTTPETAILVSTPATPSNPDIISDPTTVPPTPGYQAHTIYETLQRKSPVISVINDGNDILFVIASSDSKTWTPENPIFPGESRTFYNIYELRLRSPTAGNITAYTGGVYRITEYDFNLAYSGLNLSSTAFLGGAFTIGQANLTTILLLMLGAPMNAEIETVIPLGAGASFVGVPRDFLTSRLGFMGALAASDVVSAANGFRIQQSSDGALWIDQDNMITVAVPGGFAGRIKAIIATRYARVVYTNGAGAAAILQIGSRAMIA